jgi:carboxyl-terminal processing protease
MDKKKEGEKMRQKITKFLIIGIFVSTSILTFSSRAVCGIERKEKDELYRQVELFSDALSIIKTDYVEETEPQKLIYGALKGMLSSLDAHSQFMDPQTYQELKVETEGRFGGLGIEITIKDGLLTIITPIEDTPAWKAGLKAGDRIVKIDGQVTRDISLSEAVKKLRGAPGTEVNITVLREAENKFIDFKVVRDVIKIKDIKEARLLQDNVGYIRLIEFREGTASQLEKALAELTKQGMQSLILDLRNNPGGLLEAAVKITEQFIEKGKVIVSTRGRKKSQNMKFVSHRKNPYLDFPMVVLVNEGSASGSEIVAGALQDYKRAIILGTRTFGKGSVQTVIPLSDGSALRLTTSKYFTPKGRSIHGKGIDPDVVVEIVKCKVPEKKADIFERLEKNKPQPTVPGKQDYKTDNQVMRAVDLLKGIAIYKKSLTELNITIQKSSK